MIGTKTERRTTNKLYRCPALGETNDVDRQRRMTVIYHVVIATVLVKGSD